MEQFLASKTAQIEHQLQVARATGSRRQSPHGSRDRWRGAELFDRIRARFGRDAAETQPQALAGPGATARTPRSVAAGD